MLAQDVAEQASSLQQPANGWYVTIFKYLLISSANLQYLEVIREKVQDGVTGETREMQYTQCKIVGNGSFGVVFQTKISPNGEDAAIKRVLQDKRFKVRQYPFKHVNHNLLTPIRTASCRSCESYAIQTSSSSRLSTTPTERGLVHLISGEDLLLIYMAER